jgi:hypothetical protein
MDKHEFDVSPRVRHIRLAVYIFMDSLVPAPALALVLWATLFHPGDSLGQRIEWGTVAVLIAVWVIKVAFTVRREKRKARDAADNEPAPFDAGS